MIWNLEIKTLLNNMKVGAEKVREDGLTTGCFVHDLNSIECRKGCGVCPLDEIANKVTDGFKSIKDGPGE